MEKTNDKIGWKAHWRIDKFHDPKGEIAEQSREGTPMTLLLKMHDEMHFGTEEIDHNVALNEGLQGIIKLICGLTSPPTAWDNSNARLGVGDNNTAASATQTALQAATNKTYKAMDSGYPQRTNQTAEWRATFGSSDANYAWEEYTVVNAADDTGVNLNRVCSSKGTKSSGETWTLSLQITFS
jgi:hypothetical protein